MFKVFSRKHFHHFFLYYRLTQDILKQQKVAEAATILNTLLEEIASRKKKQSDMIMDDSEIIQNDGFIETVEFNRLFVKLIHRAAAILSSDLDLSKNV